MLVQHHMMVLLNGLYVGKEQDECTVQFMICGILSHLIENQSYLSILLKCNFGIGCDNIIFTES